MRSKSSGFALAVGILTMRMVSGPRSEHSIAANEEPKLPDFAGRFRRKYQLFYQQ